MFTHMGAGGIGIGEMAIGRRGGAGGIADFLGEGLGGFKGCRRCRRAEDRVARAAQIIRDTGGQRCLRPDDDEVDVVLVAEHGDRAAVHDVQIRAIRDHRDARIARRHDQLVAFGVL